MLSCNVKRIDPRWILILILSIIAMLDIARNLTSRVWCVENEEVEIEEAVENDFAVYDIRSGYRIVSTPSGLEEINGLVDTSQRATSFDEAMAWVNERIMEVGQKPSNYKITMYFGLSGNYTQTEIPDEKKFNQQIGYGWLWVSFKIEETEETIYTKNLIFKDNEFLTDTYEIECTSGTYSEVFNVVQEKLEETYKTVEWKVTNEKEEAVGRFYSAEKDGDCYAIVVDYTIYSENEMQLKGVGENLQNIEKILMCIAILIGVIFLYNFTRRVLG